MSPRGRHFVKGQETFSAQALDPVEAFDDILQGCGPDSQIDCTVVNIQGDGVTAFASCLRGLGVNPSPEIRHGRLRFYTSAEGVSPHTAGFAGQLVRYFGDRLVEQTPLAKPPVPLPPQVHSYPFNPQATEFVGVHLERQTPGGLTFALAPSDTNQEFRFEPQMLDLLWWGMGPPLNRDCANSVWLVAISAAGVDIDPRDRKWPPPMLR